MCDGEGREPAIAFRQMINTALCTENLEDGSAILICQTVDEWLPSLWIEALEILISSGLALGV